MPRNGKPDSTVRQFRNLPHWLHESKGGIALRSEQVPARLIDNEVRAVLDVFQEGWGIGRFELVETTLGAPYNTTLTHVSRDEGRIRKVLLASIEMDDVNNSVMRIDLEMDPPAGGGSIFAGSYSMQSDEKVNFELPVIPPGWQFQTRHDNFGGGSPTGTLRLLMLDAPAGFKI